MSAEMMVRDSAAEFEDEQVVHFARGIGVEPLVLGWPAWPLLLPPLQRGLNLLHRQVPTMHSFLANPQVHIAAAGTAAMEGGSFLDAKLEDMSAVSALLTRTNREAAGILQLATDFVTLERMLQAEASGDSLEKFYPRIPRSLQGLCELLYDANHHPRVRLYERLVQSVHAAPSHEEVRVGHVVDDRRGFFLTAPAVPSRGGLKKSIPFADPAYDVLAGACHGGVPYGRLKEVLGADLSEQGIALIGNETPRTQPPRERPEGHVRLKYFGHACVLVESRDSAVMIDPLVAWQAGKGQYSFEDLPQQLDYLAVTHGHHDHLSVETLLQLRRRTRQVLVPENNAGAVVDPSLRLMLGQLGFANVRSLSAFDSAELTDGQVMSLPFPGEHAELDIWTRQGLLVEVAGRKLLFAADSNAVDVRLYQHLAAEIGSIDALFLGMECEGAPMSWLYGPLITKPVTRKVDESRRLSASNAARAFAVVQALRPARVFLYAMGQESHVRHLAGLAYTEDSVQLVQARQFMQLCREHGVPAVHLIGAQTLVI